MSSPLSEALRAAAEALRAPGQAEWRVISPARLEAIAAEHDTPRWQVEIAALEAEIVPLLYLRNVGRVAIEGQLTLLRSRVTVVGMGAPARKCLENLAALGVGRLRVLVPVEGTGRAAGDGGSGARRRLPDLSRVAGRQEPTYQPSRLGTAQALAAAVIKLNGSLEVTAEALELRRGDPTTAMGAPDVIVVCVEEMAEETLLQAVARRLGVPLVVGGLQDRIGQVTTILPTDPGVALIYQDDHPHLDRSRPGSLREDSYHAMLLGTWLAEQVVTLRLGMGELLQNRLLYADMGSGEAQVYPLGRRTA